MPSSERFGIRFGVLRWLLVLLGTGPRFSYAEVTDGTVRVTMGWAFRSAIPLASVTRNYRDRDMRRGIGVHGWNGRWLVNGSVTGIVSLEIGPAAHARVIGLPVQLRKLHISLEDPDGFLSALNAARKVT